MIALLTLRCTKIMEYFGLACEEEASLFVRALKAVVPVAVKQPIKDLLHRPRPTDASEALARIARRGLAIATVIDVGASDGRWSRMAEQFWPRARFHMIEAFEHWRPKLDELAKRRQNYSYSLAAAGATDGGEISFTNSEANPFGGVAGPEAHKGHHWSVPAVTLDAEIKRLRLLPPYLVKLDTHGFEREIIAGASETLRHTNLLVNEFYNFQSEERRWPQMVALIEGLGFRCVDMMEPLWRSDGVLWQTDFAFIRRDRPELSKTDFS